MSFDASRFPFDPWKDFAGVVMQQGRVQLDSDWNEWLAILNRRIQAGTLDTVGRAVYPATTPYGFKIGATTDASGVHHVTIGAGRMYVHGLLAENHGPPAQAQWDPALAELSGAPQTSPPAPEADLDFTQQPYFPGAALPSGNGPFLVYLDVWRRAVTYLENPDLIEKAVGVDTTGRLQTAWQVRLLDVSSVAGGVTCSTPDTSIPAWQALLQPPAARLTTGVVKSGTPGPCCLTPNTGYTGRENQLYRVEIHQGGTTTSNPAPTFKWSRDNASVATAVTAISPATTKISKTATSQITVASTGRDNVLGFSPGDWIEITDDVRELVGRAGDLCQIDVDGVDVTNKTIRLVTPVSADIQANLTTPPGNYPHCHTRIQRWDQQGKVLKSDGSVFLDLNSSGHGDIPVPPKGTALILEDGVTVSFDLAPSNGAFRTGDFWTFAARTSDGSVAPLTEAPPMGANHHYARLAVVTFPNPPTDCRIPWPPATQGASDTCACTVCIEAKSFIGAADIVNAVSKVSGSGGGRVCFGPGLFNLGANPVVLSQSANVTLSGQGAATVLVYNGNGPALTVDACTQQRIQDLSIIATAPASAAGSTGQGASIGMLARNCAGLTVERCGIGVISRAAGAATRASTTVAMAASAAPGDTVSAPISGSPTTVTPVPPTAPSVGATGTPTTAPSGPTVTATTAPSVGTTGTTPTTAPSGGTPGTAAPAPVIQIPVATRIGDAAFYAGAATAAVGTIAGAAIALDGVMVEATFRDNALIADVGITKLTLLGSALARAGAAAPAPSLLALAGCRIERNLMLCPVAAIALGDATQQQGFCIYLLETAIDDNTVLGGNLAGIIVEGLTDPGASVRISGNDIEVNRIGIATGLDAAIVCDNVITQADVAALGRNGAAAGGIGIAVFGISGLQVPLFDMRLHRNRIVGIAGPGIVLDASAVMISIVDNTIQETIGSGISIGANAVVGDLLVRGNEVLIVSGPAAQGTTAVFGIAAGNALNAVVENNTVGGIGNAQGATDSSAAIALTRAATGTLAHNNIRDVGSTQGLGFALGIVSTGVLDDVAISSNVIRQATVPVKLANVFIGIAVQTDPDLLNIAASVQDNTVEGSSLLMLVLVQGALDCVVAGNICRHGAAQRFPNAPLVDINGATVVASHNRIQGPRGTPGLHVSATLTGTGGGAGSNPAATLVGNIVTDSILLGTAVLAPSSVWAPLNIIM